MDRTPRSTTCPRVVSPCLLRACAGSLHPIPVSVSIEEVSIFWNEKVATDQSNDIPLRCQHECAAVVTSLATTHITRAIAVSVSVYTGLASPSTASIEHHTHRAFVLQVE